MRKKRRTRRPSPEPQERAVAPLDENRLHRIALVVLAALPLVFYWKFIFGGQMLYGTDWLGAGYIHLREFMADRAFNIGLWWPAILSGQLTAAGFFADIFYLPTMLLRLVLPVYVAWTWTFVIHTFVAGLGTYLFLKELGLKVIPSALAGVAYMFAGSLMTLAYAGHDGRLIGTALIPLALFFLHRGMERRQFPQFLLCGVIVALQLLSGHLQKVYYTVLVLLGYFIVMWVKAIREERSAGTAIKLLVYFGVGMGFSLTLSAIQYLPVYGNLPFASRGAERGYAYATSWSMSIIETFDLITPRFSGGLENYWGGNPFKLHSEYLGVLPLLFAVVAIARAWKRRTVRFFTITFVAALLMAWGGNTPFYRIPYHLLPGISMFRGPGMIFFIAAFSLAVLAGFGLQRLLDAPSDKKRSPMPRALLIAAAVPVVMLLLFAIAKGPIISMLKPSVPQKVAALNANFPNMTTGLLIATIVSLVGLGVVSLLVRRRMRAEWFAAAIALVMTVDIGVSLNLWNEAKGYIRGVPPPAEYFAEDEAVAFLKRDTSMMYRVMPMNYQRSRDGVLTYHGIQSVGGELPNPLQTYQDYIGAGKSVMFEVGNLAHPNFMNLLNVKYVIGPTLPEDASRYDAQSRQVIEQLRGYFADPRFEPAMVGRQYTVYRNTLFLPRAFFVPGYRVVKDKDEVLGLLMRRDFPATQTVLLYEDPGFSPTADSMFNGGADITHYDANRIELSTRASAEALLVLSENWHPAWKAAVDGEPVPILRAYHTLRAIRVGPGEHEVVLTYDSVYYNLGLLLTAISLAFLLVAIGVTVVRRRKK